MKFFFSFKKGSRGEAGKKLVIFLLVFLFLFSFAVNFVKAIPVEPVTPIVVGVDIPATTGQVKTTIWQSMTKMLQKAGSVAFNRTLSSALNKIAYDAANYIGSGGTGQKSLFVTLKLDDYIKQIGDEAAGQFIESFVNNLNADNPNANCSDALSKCRKDCEDSTAGWKYAGLEDNMITTALTACATDCDKQATACASANANSAGAVTPSFNVCSPSSLEAKVKIGLGLVDTNRPQGPNCTASKMINDWGDSIEKKMASLRDPNYLDTFTSIFDPRSNDLGIYVTAKAGMAGYSNEKEKTSNDSYVASQGWLDVRNIAGKLEGVPGEAQRAANTASEVRQQALGKTTGDILVDAANIFLNQMLISSYDTLLRSLAKKTGSNSNSSSGSNLSLNNISDPNSFSGTTALKKTTNRLLQPDFSVRANYDILSSLAVCPDPKNPGPDNCVIDDKFLQAISEKKTVAEAMRGEYLHGDWQFKKNDILDSYNSVYSLRNLSILRKYRILPVGWEEAALRIANSTSPRQATLKDLVSCFDPNDEYDQFSSGFDADYSWCRGLVDPNWVLKAPLNYCQKQGFGAQVLNINVIPGIKSTQVGVDDTPSEINITRADDYCADNKTCIKEKGDGSCDVFGYCNEDRRTWNFGTDSCEPINNTCQAFTGSAGQSVAYLKNTLDYADCNADNYGCRRYSLFGAYSTSTGKVSWDENKSLYLNKNLGTCTSKDEACTELLRVKPTWGANLVMDSDFASGKTTNWPVFTVGGAVTATIVDASVEPGGESGKALKLQVSGSNSHGIYSNSSNSLLPSNFQVIPGQSYTVSADVYLAAAVTSVTLSLGTSTDGFVKTTTSAGSWQHLSVTRPANTSYNEPTFSLASTIVNNPAIFYLKNLKFEMSDWDTGNNKPYGSFKVYEKLLPPYLEKTCYNNVSGASKDYNLKSDAPNICSNYARKCSKDEVGCDLYTNSGDKFAVAARTTSDDYCPEQCLGYDFYVSKLSYFNPPSVENLIPEKTTTCTAAAVGCNEFTNLDSLAQGGEQKEYYTSLKQCVKPSVSSCAAFYSWEGQGSSYQLRSYSLKKTAAGLPDVTANDSALCNATIFNLPLSDPDFNSDCREFYNIDGQVAYHLISRTITCSDNCHAYRLTGKNIDKSLAQASCTGTRKHWDNVTGCSVCLNGGVWDNANSACVYQAVPGEGQVCQANENGCREYNGNVGNNVRLVAYYDFENSLGGWFSNDPAAISSSTVSNNNNGHSLKYIYNQTLATQAMNNISGFVNQGNAYNIKFLARTVGTSNVDLQFSILNRDTGATASFNLVTVKSGNDWNLYQANLINLDHAVGPNELLVIGARGDFYIDDLVLSETTDRYYLIKNSSQVPDICYYDMADNYQGPDYNLGCAQYSDRGNLKHNLRKFTRLCSNSAVGCEQMIDTKNSSNPFTDFWQDGIATTTCAALNAGCVSVPTDAAIYAVYDPTKLCTATNKGCSRLGQGQGGGNLIAWSDIFASNDPDKYSSILCGQGNVGCERWANKDDGSFSYFKDPGFNVCSYRAGQDPKAIGFAWYSLPVKRCDVDANGKIDGNEKGSVVCLSDSGCGTKKCITDTNDYPCSVTYSKTIGLGGEGNRVPTPDKATGQCDSAASGCTEYIDPVSQFSVNLVNNPGYKLVNGYQDDWGDGTGKKWRGGLLADDQQVIKLDNNKLYSLNTKINTDDGSLNGNVSLNFLNNVEPLVNNSWEATTPNIALANGDNQPIIFNSLNNFAALLGGGTSTKIIEIRELAVNYQLQTKIDRDSCNGLYKVSNGCILFNERSVNGATGVANLSNGWDAYTSLDGAAPTLCNSVNLNSCTANQLIKVTPDRVCSKWLECTTYIQDPKVPGKKVCYAVGECNRLDDNNECANFSTSVSTGIARFNAEIDKNATGYSLPNYYNVGQIQEVGRKAGSDSYDFEGGSLALSCLSGGAISDCPLDNGSLPSIDDTYLVNEPNDKNMTDYPAEGKAYLRVPANRQISPQASGASNLITLNPSEYYINYLVNTKKFPALKARLTIVDKDNKVLQNTDKDFFGQDLVFDSSATGGWQRKINKFKLNTQENIRIILSSDSADTGATGDVYFDDIKIEPVLVLGEEALGENRYATRECRLYPSESSLSCDNINKNVIADGLEGYCLQHDAYNPKVCLVWYPVDRISSAQNFSTMGYQGKFPLHYCVEANGNFDLVEKRMAYRKEAIEVNNSTFRCGQSFFNGDLLNNSTPVQGCYKYVGCNQCPTNYDTWISWDVCPSSVGCDNRLKVICVPNTIGLLGFKQSANSSNDVGGNFDWEQCENNSFFNGYGKYDGLDGYESTNMNPPIRVYNHNNPPATESDLKLLSNTTDPDDPNIFRLTCNKFVEVVNGKGENKAWVVRNSTSSNPTSTPNFFVNNAVPYAKYSVVPGIIGYGLNRDNGTYGAASLPNGIANIKKPVNFRNQYSTTNNENIFAGRPYGCNNGSSGTGCSLIGSCSSNPDVYCILNSVINTCGSSGTCNKIWNTPLLNILGTEHYKSILSKLFLNSYGSYDYNGSNAYTPSNGYDDYSQRPLGLSPFRVPCTNGERVGEDINSFCAIFPTVDNLKLYYGDNTDPLADFNVKSKGYYRLQFNSYIDDEQQPLKNIIIDWGDDNVQAITGQDERSIDGDPHVFYHYYGETGRRDIRVKVDDNWGLYGCSSSCPQ